MVIDIFPRCKWTPAFVFWERRPGDRLPYWYLGMCWGPWFIGSIKQGTK